MNDKPWPRAIVLVDMNAFFASIEQQDDPDLRGRPVAVTNGLQGTCIITCSYEARARGVRTGMRLKEARRLCPDLVQCPARPHRYAQVSRAIMAALVEVTPDVEVFSVDEAFLDVTGCQRLWGSPEAIGRKVKAVVREASGLACSVGIAGDKTTAKYAAKLHKPDGLTVIPPWAARETLAPVPVTELCGINRGIGRFLAERGVRVCGDMPRLPMAELARRFGNPGRRIWLMAQGLDPEPVRPQVAPPKSIGHGKIIPPDTRDRALVLTYLRHMSEKVGARLRRHDLEAQHFFIGLRLRHDWLAEKTRTHLPTTDGKAIFEQARALVNRLGRGQGVFQVQVTALDPRPQALQGDLFDRPDPRRAALNAVMDRINRRYGDFTLAPAPLLQRSTMPDVIAPAWKPDGHRDSLGESGEKTVGRTARTFGSVIDVA